ncbi:MMPL family transporter [Chloroflexota bacterium]
MEERQKAGPAFFTGRIVGWAYRHHRLALLSWICIALILIGSCTVGANEDIQESGRGDSGEAGRLMDERFESTGTGGDSETIVFSHPTLTVDDEEYRDTVLNLLEDLRALRWTKERTVGDTLVSSSPRVFTSTFSHYDIGAPREFSPLVSQNETGGDVTFASATYAGDFGENKVDAITALVSEAAEESDFEILIGGAYTINNQIGEIIEEDFGIASMWNITLTLIIMLIALGGLIAAGVPVILAYLGVLMAAGAVTLISYLVPMMDGWIQIVLLMGLAAGIDYTLFLFTRFRAEREQGHETRDALTTAGHTAGKGIFIAATTTVLALLGMFLIRNEIFNSIGFAAVLSILIALAVALTLTPTLMGNRISRWNIPKIGRRYNVAQAGVLNPLAGRLVRMAVGHRWIVGFLGLALMLGLTYPMFSLNLGFNGARSFHDDLEAKKAILALEDYFTIGLLQPAIVVVDPGEGNNIFAADVQQSVNSLTESVLAENERARDGGEHVPFAMPIDTFINRAGDMELIKIPINADTGDKEALDAIRLLRNELIPNAFPDDSPQALVTGTTAGQFDFQEGINAKTPFVILFVVLTAFIVLVLLYRSLLIPLIAVFLNLLAVGAAYGVLTLVFQEGWALEGLLHFEATGIIETWLPLFVFTVMFGISMDYLTFAIGRVQELYHRGWKTEDAIYEGIRGSFGVVGSAAAIMIMVAALFAILMRFFAMQQVGFALAIAVLIDTTLILLVMLPALMRVAGDRLWYLPSWLDWIPGGPKDISEPIPDAPALMETVPPVTTIPITPTVDMTELDSDDSEPVTGTEEV